MDSLFIHFDYWPKGIFDRCETSVTGATLDKFVPGKLQRFQNRKIKKPRRNQVIS